MQHLVGTVRVELIDGFMYLFLGIKTEKPAPDNLLKVIR